MATMRKVVVPQDAGLSAQPAAVLAATASQFSAEITLRYGMQAADAKSILSLMALMPPPGAVVTIIAEGADAREAVSTIERLFQVGG